MARPLALLLFLVSCGTGAAPAGGDQNLPNQLAGPFRVLRAGEISGKAPFVVDRSPPWEAPAALDLDDDPATMGVAIYASWGAPATITRFELADGRSLKKNGERVLSGGEPWEGQGGVAAPAVVRQGREVWMYYAAGGCVGRAVSSDNGKTFEKSPTEPVFCAGATWEAGAVGAPALMRGNDGLWHLFYEAAGSIGEATSSDGVAFTRGGGPILKAPEAAPLAEGATTDEVFDSASVGEPFAVQSASPLGRQLTLVYYTATNRLGRTAVAMAAREGDAGPLTRNPAPVLTRYDARGPAVLRFGEVTMLYAAGRDSEVAKTWRSVIVGAVAPADRSLPAPDPTN